MTTTEQSPGISITKNRIPPKAKDKVSTPYELGEEGYRKELGEEG